MRLGFDGVEVVPVVFLAGFDDFFHLLMKFIKDVAHPITEILLVGTKPDYEHRLLELGVTMMRVAGPKTEQHSYSLFESNLAWQLDAVVFT